MVCKKGRIILLILSIAVTAAVVDGSVRAVADSVIDLTEQEYIEGIEMFAVGVEMATVLFFDVFVLGNVWGTYASIGYFLRRRSERHLWQDICHAIFLLYHFIMILTAVLFFPSHGLFDQMTQYLVIIGVFMYVPVRFVFSVIDFFIKTSASDHP